MLFNLNPHFYVLAKHVTPHLTHPSYAVFTTPPALTKPWQASAFEIRVILLVLLK
jgi:hypothetical protein